MIIICEKLQFWDTHVTYMFQLYQGSDAETWYCKAYAAV